MLNLALTDEAIERYSKLPFLTLFQIVVISLNNDPRILASDYSRRKYPTVAMLIDRIRTLADNGKFTTAEEYYDPQEDEYSYKIAIEEAELFVKETNDFFYEIGIEKDFFQWRLKENLETKETNNLSSLEIENKSLQEEIARLKAELEQLKQQPQNIAQSRISAPQKALFALLVHKNYSDSPSINRMKEMINADLSEIGYKSGISYNAISGYLDDTNNLNYKRPSTKK